ncbi:HNH endonuclease signature motif containing protein [Gordonia sp. DT219]|uniref:HNH endonuclease signature motif containing protein n=1 Tax=Gordonia sp. DT219 TaxID=3416658 RepID=UPI003CEFC903
MIDDTALSASLSAELSADLFAGLITQLDDRTFRADITSREAFAAMQQLITLRNMLDHLAATMTGEFDRLKMTAPQGRSVRQLLITMGIAPAVASRLVRVGTTTELDGLRIHTVDGAISLDHADAVVLGLTHIESRAGEPITPEQRRDHTVSTTSRYDILLTLNAHQPDRSALQHMGPVTDQLATTLTCDAQLTVAILDDEQAPLQLGRRKRLFTNAQRKAFILRDECCVKCGAPASRTQSHHLRHWADGGPTDLDNGCLLCTSCHHDVHDRAGAGSEASGPNDYWDVVMGFDRHPWLIPPATVDPKRRPLPAYNRRTLRLDNAA